MKQQSQQQQTGLTRNTQDKFYTKPEIVYLCLDFIQKHLHIDPINDLIIEPSAGNGSFIQGIQSLSLHSLFYDVYPENDAIIQQDYLLLENPQCKNHRIHIIGNPPFGRQSSSAIQFIKKSCEFCDTISFILPKSFKKNSLKKSFPLYFHLIAEMDLPEKSFLVNAEEYTVETVFQIWEKKTTERIITTKIEPLHFQFVNKTNNPDIAVRRVGVNAGIIINKPEIHEKSIQSHYFIQFTNGKPTDENVELLKQIRFQHNNTVGPRSISKPELIDEFNKYLT